MFLKEYKFEIIIGSSLSFLSVYLFYQLMTIKPRAVNPMDKISFEMIRPHTDKINDFSLEDRQIDSRFINPFVKKDILDNHVNKNPKQNLVPIKNKVAQKKTDKAKKTEKRKSGMEVKIVSRDPQNPMSQNEENYNNHYQQVNNTRSAKADDKQKADANKNELDPEHKTKSMSEFVDLLTDPKPERIGELVTAIQNNEINKAELYNFIGKMLKSEKSNVQSVGVYLAYYVPTYESFQLVASSQETLNPEVKSYSEQFLTSFTQPSKLAVLAQALQSSDIKVIVKAGEVIISGLQKIKSGQTIDYGARSNRGDNTVKPTSVLGYFLPIAESLKSSQNQTIASIGMALSQQLSQFTNTP